MEVYRISRLCMYLRTGTFSKMWFNPYRLRNPERISHCQVPNELWTHLHFDALFAVFSHRSDSRIPINAGAAYEPRQTLQFCNVNIKLICQTLQVHSRSYRFALIQDMTQGGGMKTIPCRM